MLTGEIFREVVMCLLLSLFVSTPNNRGLRQIAQTVADVVVFESVFRLDPRFTQKNAPEKSEALSKQKCEGVVYQLALVIPGISPSEAISRRVMRESPNLR